MDGAHILAETSSVVLASVLLIAVAFATPACNDHPITADVYRGRFFSSMTISSNITMKNLATTSVYGCNEACWRLPECIAISYNMSYIGEGNCKLFNLTRIQKHMEAASDSTVILQLPVLSTQEWSPWSPWSVCSVSCGCGTVIKTRTCFLGESCNGTDQESRTCNTGVPCTVIINCGFETDMCGLTNLYDGDRTWKLMKTATTTTARTGEGYLYFNGGIYSIATVDVLIPEPGCYAVAFYYHMKGDGPRKLYVYAMNSDRSEPFVRIIDGNQGDAWHYFSESFEMAMEGKLRMYAHDGSEVNDQFAIDDLVLRSSCCN